MDVIQLTQAKSSADSHFKKVTIINNYDVLKSYLDTHKGTIVSVTISPDGSDKWFHEDSYTLDNLGYELPHQERAYIMFKPDGTKCTWGLINSVPRSK